MRKFKTKYNLDKKKYQKLFNSTACILKKLMKQNFIIGSINIWA